MFSIASYKLRLYTIFMYNYPTEHHSSDRIYSNILWKCAKECDAPKLVYDTDVIRSAVKCDDCCQKLCDVNNLINSIRRYYKDPVYLQDIYVNATSQLLLAFADYERARYLIEQCNVTVTIRFIKKYLEYIVFMWNTYRKMYYEACHAEYYLIQLNEYMDQHFGFDKMRLLFNSVDIPSRDLWFDIRILLMEMNDDNYRKKMLKPLTRYVPMKMEHYAPIIKVMTGAAVILNNRYRNTSLLDMIAKKRPDLLNSSK